MDIKICTCCHEKLPATLEFFYKQKNGKYGLNSMCKICGRKSTKEYRKTPVAKENHRLRMIEWREKNREKALEIQRKSYNKNRDRLNETKRSRYINDPEYRKKCFERERKYKESGRRYEVNSKPEQMEKARKRSKRRRLDPKKREHDYARGEQWRKENKDYLNEYYKKFREELRSSYVAQSMRKKVAEISPEIIETKRLIIKIKRELKNV